LIKKSFNLALLVKYQPRNNSEDASMFFSRCIWSGFVSSHTGWANTTISDGHSHSKQAMAS